MMRKFFNAITLKPIEGFFFIFIITVTVGLLATPYYQFAILPGLSILLLFILGYFPNVGYYIIVFLIPFGAYSGFTDSYRFITISKFIGLWIVIVISFSFLLKNKKTFNIQSDLWLLFLVFFVISLISALTSNYYPTSFDNIRKLLTAYLLFTLTLVLVSHKDYFKTLPFVITMSVAICSFVSIIGYVFDIPLFAMNFETLKRATGTVNDPNIFSLLAIISLPILAHLSINSSNILVKIVTVLIFIMNVIAIVLSYSRGGAIILAIILVLLSVEYIHKLRPKYLGFVGVFLLIAIFSLIFFVPVSYWERQKSVFNIKEDTAVGRRISYSFVGWEAFKERPFVGSGPGTFRDIYTNSNFALQFVGSGKTEIRRFAHNSYLEVLIGTGILGLLAFLAIIVLTLKNFYFAKKRFHILGEERMASLTGAYRLSFVAIMMYFLFLSSTYHKYFWITIALSQIALRLSDEMKEKNCNVNVNPY